MSFSDLVTGGPSCGPSNPLQNLGKRFGQDRSTQMDRFNVDSDASVDGESSRLSSFRQQQIPRGAQNNPEFFQMNGAPPHAFNLQSLKGALPHSQAPADLHGAWNQSHGAGGFEQQMHRNTPPPMMAQHHVDAQWAREYSPQSMSADHAHHSPLGTQHQESRQQVRQQLPNRYPVSYANGPMNFQPHLHSNMMQYRPNTMVHGSAQSSALQQTQQSESSTISNQWDTAFTEMEQRSKSASPNGIQAEGDPAVAQQRPIDPNDADEFARTAGRLVSTVEHETNDKFKQSNFLNLMRKIRDRQAGIQGTDIVESVEEGPAAASSLDKGKGRAHEPMMNNPATTTAQPINQMEAMQRDQSGPKVVHTARILPAFDEEMASRKMLNDLWAEEDARSEAIETDAMRRMAFVGDGGDTAALRAEDEAEFNKYQNLLGAHLGPAAAGMRQKAPTAGMEEEIDELEGADFVGRGWQGTQGTGKPDFLSSGEWSKLQEDWDNWQASSAGVEQVNKAPPQSAANAPAYRFHAYNPYVGAAVSNAVPHASTASLPPDMQSVLEREAAVQRDPNDASAWLELGVKQQENERENLAIAALHRAIQLDPTMREAWLALAVSYTNESERGAALEAVERWIDATPGYRAVAQQHRASSPSATSKADQAPTERHEDLTNLLIALARHSSAEGKIDADVQVALGVLFNASEDFDKAVDCFSTALQVRPDDWLMYNRLGATLSNSGRSAEALRYYQQALDLKPGFVRCHFNMSISCLNLQMYREAASHIYTALTLQSESVDLSHDAAEREQGGVTSSSLWETLRVACELMDRPDLANLAMQRDLDRFDPSEFWSSDAAAMEPTV